MDINTVKAGRYQLTVDRWDRQTSKPGEPFTFERFSRGDQVMLSEEDARRLVACGAAVLPGSIEKAEALAATRRLKGLLAQVPDDVRAELVAELGEQRAEALLTGTPPPNSPAGAAVSRPKDTAGKAPWLEFAVASGMDRVEAEKLSRDELAARFPAG